MIGIPAALGLYGQLPLWKRFFSLLDIPIVASEGFEAGIELGREVQGAEFCAPLAALHGHVKHLRDKADWIFLPVLLEESRPGSVEPRLYCYYTQFSSALASGAVDARLRQRCLMPQVSWTKWRERSKRELYQALAAAGCAGLSQSRVSRAFERASAEYEAGVRALQRRFREETRGRAEPCVVLLGRPYNVLSPEMSKGIPDMFGTLGVKTFFQDMVPYGPADVSGSRRSWTWCTGCTRPRSWKLPASWRTRRTSTRSSSRRSSAPLTALPSSTSSASWTTRASRT